MEIEFRRLNGTRAGYIDGIDVKDANGGKVGYINKEEIRDSFGNRVGYLNGNEIRDNQGNRKAYINGNEIRDSLGNKIGGYAVSSAAQIQMAAAALLLFNLENQSNNDLSDEVDSKNISRNTEDGFEINAGVYAESVKHPNDTLECSVSSTVDRMYEGVTAADFKDYRQGEAEARRNRALADAAELRRIQKEKEEAHKILHSNALLFEKAEKGDIESMYKSAILYTQWPLKDTNLEGTGINAVSGETKGLKFLEKAGKKGYIPAMLTLANSQYQNHQYDAAIKWYEKAAKKGNVDAQYKLGHIYYCAKQHIKKAFEWYAKAEKQGHQGAHEALESSKRLYPRIYYRVLKRW